jgi:hypothetical protein
VPFSETGFFSIVLSNHSQVGISCDLLRPRASPLREISFGQGLQTPESATLTKLRPVGLHGPRGRARALSTLTSHSLRQGMHVWLTGARWAPLYERSAAPAGLIIAGAGTGSHPHGRLSPGMDHGHQPARPNIVTAAVAIVAASPVPIGDSRYW